MGASGSTGWKKVKELGLRVSACPFQNLPESHYCSVLDVWPSVAEICGHPNPKEVRTLWGDNVSAMRL